MSSAPASARAFAALLATLAILAAAPSAAAWAAGASRYPLVFKWDFELPEVAGRQLFAQDPVPIAVDERRTQPHWTQLFGRQASAARPDLYSRGNLAGFTAQERHGGKRSMLIVSRGDNAFVALDTSQRQPIFGEAEFTLRGWLKSRASRGADAAPREEPGPAAAAAPAGAATLRVLARFYVRGNEIPESRLASTPVALETADWRRAIELQGRAPTQAEQFDVVILLEGSPHAPLVQVWVDDLEVEIMPGCRLSWPGRTNLLFQPGEPMNLKAESFGLQRGDYTVEVRIGRVWPSSPEPVASFSRRRFVPSERQPLRLLEDLHSQFFRDAPNMGAGLYQVEARILDGDNVLSVGEQSFAWVGPWEGSTPKPVILLGWILPFERVHSGRWVQKLHLGSPGFPLHQTLISLEDWAPPSEGQPGTTAGEVLDALKAMVATSQDSTSWCARVRWEAAPAGVWSQLFVQALPGLRIWEIVAERELSAEDTRMLLGLRRESPILEFGARPDTRGRLPEWAQFRIFEVDPKRMASLPTDVEAKDWAVVSLPTRLDTEGRISYFGRLSMQLAEVGFRRIFIDNMADFFLMPTASRRDFLPPEPYLLSWIGTGRFLAKFAPLKSFEWDPRGRFLLFNDYDGHDVLATFADSAEPFTIDIWTGEPVEARDLLGSPIAVAHDPATGFSRVRVEQLPVLVSPLPTGRVETAASLERLTTGLRPWPRTQALAYRLTNQTNRPIEVGLHLKPPEGWSQRPLSETVNLAPGKIGQWSWEVDLPQPPPMLRSFAFTVTVQLGDSGKTYRYQREDRILVGSDLVEVEVDALPLGTRTLPIRLRNISPGDLRLAVFSRAVGAEDEGAARTWSQVRLARKSEPADPRSTRELVHHFPMPLRDLVGREIWIGFQVGGRGDFNTFAFKVAEEGGLLYLRR